MNFWLCIICLIIVYYIFGSTGIWVLLGIGTIITIVAKWFE